MKIGIMPKIYYGGRRDPALKFSENFCVCKKPKLGQDPEVFFICIIGMFGMFRFFYVFI